MDGAVPDRLAAALADRYRIERELGAGGMATVYLARRAAIVTRDRNGDAWMARVVLVGSK